MKRPRRPKAPRPRFSGVLHYPAAEPDTVPITTWGTYNPAPVGPPPQRTHQVNGDGYRVTMTVNTDGPAPPMNAGVRAARTWLDLKVAYLEAQGLGFRIDENEHVMQRGEAPADRLMADTLREGVTHLMSSRAPCPPPDPSGTRAAYQRHLGGVA